VSDTEQTCECGHHVGSHNSLLYNCMATTDGTHDTRCSCRKFAPSPSGEPPAVSDTRILCAVCGIWQCLARHGGGFCHAVNGPSDTSCGACYANRPTIKPDLTVGVASPLPEEPPTEQRIAEIAARLDAATCAPWTHHAAGPVSSLPGELLGGFVASCGSTNTQKHYVVPHDRVYWKPNSAADDAEFIAHVPTDIAYLLAERSRLTGENAELRKDAERWQYFRRFLSVERDRYTPTQYVVADVNLIVETTVREGVNHTVELLVDVARFSAGATGDRE
jgi:hypothetical protein